MRSASYARRRRSEGGCDGESLGIAIVPAGKGREEVIRLKDKARRPKGVFLPQNSLSEVDIARAHVCSDCVFSVLDELFQEKNLCNYPGGNPAPIILPCSFYANPNFKDVDLDPIDIEVIA